jgi:hypothetical protein
MRAWPGPVAALLLAPTLAGCGGGASTGSSTAAAGSTGAAAPAIAAADRPACALLFARLQRVTVALSTSSELIARSANKEELGRRIAVEQQQLERSAALMAGGPVPAPLVDADGELVAALRAFAADFARARKPAARGDFQAAADAMTDPPVVQRIVRASKTIEDACG